MIETFVPGWIFSQYEENSTCLRWNLKTKIEQLGEEFLLYIFKANIINYRQLYWLEYIYICLRLHNNFENFSER